MPVVATWRRMLKRRILSLLRCFAAAPLGAAPQRPTTPVPPKRGDILPSGSTGGNVRQDGIDTLDNDLESLVSTLHWQ